MPFLTPLDIRALPGGRRFTLLFDLIYKGRRDRFVIPAGFETDLASIPRIFTPLVTKLGPWNTAAVVHDWLYQVQTTTRKDADGIFRRILKEEGVGGFKRWGMWQAVRLGGWVYWNKNRG